MNVPIKLIKMSQTYKQNNDAEGDKIECCICYNDNSEESNEGKLIECCPNKHILCVGCFHKSYERKCECPLCRELMFRPRIMTDVEMFAYYGAKLQKEERERVIAERQRVEAERQRVEAERQRAEAERQRQEQLEHLPVRKAERKQIIQRRKDEFAQQMATCDAEMENIDNLGLDEYNALYPPNFERRTTPVNTISDSDSDTDDDSVELIYGPAPTRPVQQPVARPEQPVARPVQPVARPVTQAERIIQLLGTRPVQQPARPVQQPVARPVQQPVARPVTQAEQIIQLLGRPVQPVQQPVARPERPVQQRRSSTYAYDKLVQNELLVQTLRDHRMVVRYDRLNDRFIRVSDNTFYPTLHRASAAHALEVGLATTPNAWTTFKRFNGSSIDNL